MSECNTELQNSKTDDKLKLIYKYQNGNGQAISEGEKRAAKNSFQKIRYKYSAYQNPSFNSRTRI